MPDGGGPMQLGRPPRPNKCEAARSLVQQQRQNLRQEQQQQQQQQQQRRQQRQEQGEAELLWSLSSVDLSQAKLVMDNDGDTVTVADLSSPEMTYVFSSVRDSCAPAASPSPTASLASLLTSPFGSPSFTSSSPFAASAFSFSPSASSSTLSASASSLTSSAVSLGQRVSSAVLAGAQHWCVALAEEALRLADDFARGDIFSAVSPKSKAGGLEQLPQRLWRRCFQYRRLVLAATAVFLVNSIFSFLLFESLLGGAHLCAWGRCSPPPLLHHSSAAAYDIASLDPPHRPSPSSSRALSSSPSARTLSSIPLSANSSSSDLEAQTADRTSSRRQFSSELSSSSSPQASSAISVPTLSSQPADDAFINELAESWDVNPYPGIPRAYLLRRRVGPRHHRALLLQDACYLFAGGSGKEHDGRHTGVWFDADSLSDAVTLGTSSAQQRRGTGPSGISAAAVDGRELSRINLVSELVAAADREAKVAKSSRQDLNAARRRVERTVGEFVGPTGLARYVLSSSPTAKRLLRGWKQQDPEYIGVVGGFESTLGSVSTHAVFLSDVVGTGSPSWQSAAVFFPGDKKVRSEWAVGALRAAVGEHVAAVPGQVEGQPSCFRNVMFTLVHGPPSLEEIVSFRHKAERGLALPGLGLSPLSSQTLVTMLVNPEGEAESASEHRPQRIANLPEVQAAIQRTFPHLNVKVLDAASASFAESMSLLQHTALLVTPHGCPKGLVLSLPRGASVLELFPYHFTSEAIHIMSALAGVKHFKWESARAADGVYEESCLAKGKYAALTAADCRRKRDCLFCVRDRVSTIVDIQQLQKVLAEAKLAVGAFSKSAAVQSV